MRVMRSNLDGTPVVTIGVFQAEMIGRQSRRLTDASPQCQNGAGLYVAAEHVAGCMASMRHVQAQSYIPSGLFMAAG